MTDNQPSTIRETMEQPTHWAHIPWQFDEPARAGDQPEEAQSEEAKEVNRLKRILAKDELERGDHEPIRLSLKITPDAMAELNRWMNMLYLTGKLKPNRPDPATLMCGHILAAALRWDSNVVIDMNKVKPLELGMPKNA